MTPATPPHHAPYQVSDTLYLWLLTDPAVPVLVGELHTARTVRGVSLRYLISNDPQHSPERPAEPEACTARHR